METFTITQNNNQGVIVETVTVDGTPTTAYTLSINPAGQYIVILDTAPAVGAEVDITYRLGSLRQIYAADDARHYDVAPDFTIFMGGNATPVNMPFSPGFAGRQYDQNGDELPVYTSRYLLPVQFIVNSTSPNFTAFKESIRVFEMDDSVTGITNVQRQVLDTDYTMVDMFNYKADLITDGWTQDEVDEHVKILRVQYKDYINSFYISDLDRTETYTFNNTMHQLPDVVTIDAVTKITVDGIEWPIINNPGNESFDGDGATLTFVFTGNNDDEVVPITVFVDGAFVDEADYSISYNGTDWEITLTSAPIIGVGNVNVNYQYGSYAVIQTPSGDSIFKPLVHNKVGTSFQYNPALLDIVSVDYVTEEFTTIFENSIIVEFNTHHFAINNGTPADAGIIPKKILFDYEIQEISFRLHLNEMDEHILYRNSDAASAFTTSITLHDQEYIEVDTVANLPVPDANTKGVAWLGSERITYAGIVGNKLMGVTRHTQGTSIDVSLSLNGSVNSTYDIGKKVIAGDDAQLIVTNKDHTLWANNIGGVGLSTTPEAIFLRTGAGSATGT